MNAEDNQCRVRLNHSIWQSLSETIFDRSRGERAGVLLVRPLREGNESLLIGTSFIPVPDKYIMEGSNGLDYDGRFNFRVIEALTGNDSGAILVHAHLFGTVPRFSKTDMQFGQAYLDFIERRVPGRPHGMAVLSSVGITGVINMNGTTVAIDLLSANQVPYVRLLHATPISNDADDRQQLALGKSGQAALKSARVAVVGYSGGGSHVVQQLVHAGVGSIVVIDPDRIETTNLRRFVGAIMADIGALKTSIAIRLARAVRPETKIISINEKIPSTATINALMEVDVLVGCVDNWSTRDVLNRLAHDFQIPYVDIGAAIVPESAGSGLRIGGQITVATDDGPCLSCLGLLTPARIEAGLHRQRYDESTPEPQVVSINGTLASEAVTAVILLLAGSSPISRYRRYQFPPGKLSPVSSSKKFDCETCAVTA